VDLTLYWVASGFIFRRTSSPIHDLDPRVKLLISIELFSLALAASRMEEVALVFGSILTLALIGRIMRRLGKTVLFALGFAVMIFLINIFVGYPLVSAVEVAARFVTIVGSTSVFFLTTSPDELEHVMKWFRFPRDLVFAFVTAVRFVPVLLMDALQIMDAQKSRGLELDKGNPLKRIKNFGPILVPLVVNAVVRSGELAEAMESRGYGAVKKPTTLYGLTTTKKDRVVVLGSLLLSIPVLFFFIVS